MSNNTTLTLNSFAVHFRFFSVYLTASRMGSSATAFSKALTREDARLTWRSGRKFLIIIIIDRCC